MKSLAKVENLFPTKYKINHYWKMFGNKQNTKIKKIGKCLRINN